MKVQTHAIHFHARKDLLDFVQKKVSKLETFYGRIIDAEIFLKVDKGESSREDKIAEIKLNVPGQCLFSSQSGTSFEAATDAAVEGLRRQLKRHKEKLIGKH